MRTILTTLVVLGGVTAATPALADDSQVWGKINVTVGLGDGWRLNNELEARTGNAKGFYEGENSLLLGYKTGQVTIAAGYTHVPGYLHGHPVNMEHRLRSQVTVDNFAAIGPVKLTGRMRMETRWREGQTGTGWRLRPYLKASMPVRGKVSLNLSAEPFVDLGRTSFQKVDGLERLRSQISLSMPVSRNVSVELGYLDQHAFVRSGPDTDDNSAVMAVSASF